ncbi:unnamed protein product, partial [marine sediment metagenome]
EAKSPTIVFLDDLGQGAAAVQKAYMQLILARRINGHMVSDQVVFVAATNRREDKAGVTGILEPVKSRFKSILHLEVNAKDWIEWALENDVHMGVVGWIHYQPNMLTAGKPTNDIVNHPCPRTVTNASDLLKADMGSHAELSGALGEVGAASLRGFLNVYENLPDLDTILDNPDSAIIPDEPSALYATAMALVERANKSNANNIFRYIGRWQGTFADVAAYLVEDMRVKHPETSSTSGYIQWITDHADMYSN